MSLIDSKKITKITNIAPVNKRFGSSETRVLSARVGIFERLERILSRWELLIYMVKKELSVRYRSSFMGMAWSMINPALQLAVWYFVFQYVMKNSIPYFAIYLMAGLLAWNFFSTSLQQGASAVVESAGIVKKVSFPREILALAKVGQATFFFFLQLLVLAITMLAVGFVPDFKLIWLFLLAFLNLVVLTSAIAIILSALNVFFRDIQHFVEVALFAWFFGTPIVYSFQQQLYPSLSHHHLVGLFLSDPVTIIILTFQKVLYAKMSYTSGGNIIHILPSYSDTTFLIANAAVFVVSAGLFLVALKIFGHFENNFAEEL